MMTAGGQLPKVWLPVNGNNLNNPENIFWTDDAILQSSIPTNTWEEILLLTKELGFTDDFLKREALAHGFGVSKSAISELWAQYKRACFELQYPSGEMPVGHTLLLPSMSNRAIELLTLDHSPEEIQRRFLAIRSGGLARSLQDMQKLNSESLTKVGNWKTPSPKKRVSPLKTPSSQQRVLPRKTPSSRKQPFPQKTPTIREQRKIELRMERATQSETKASPSKSKSNDHEDGILPPSYEEVSSGGPLPQRASFSTNGNAHPPPKLDLFNQFEFTMDMIIRGFPGNVQMLRELMDISFEKHVSSKPVGFIIKSLDLENAAKLIHLFDGYKVGEERLQVGCYRQEDQIAGSDDTVDAMDYQTEVQNYHGAHGGDLDHMSAEMFGNIVPSLPLNIPDGYPHGSKLAYNTAEIFGIGPSSFLGSEHGTVVSDEFNYHLDETSGDTILDPSRNMPAGNFSSVANTLPGSTFGGVDGNQSAFSFVETNSTVIDPVPRTPLVYKADSTYEASPQLDVAGIRDDSWNY